jgi:hypothetical protein
MRSEGGFTATKIVVSVRRFADGNAEFRAGRYRQIIPVKDLGMVETYEAIKWAAIVGGIYLEEEHLEELFRQARGMEGGEK